MKPENLLKPGLGFMLALHDSDCPGAQGDAESCCCSPEYRVVSEAEFTKSVTKSRAERRAAARAAAKAIGKAGHRGAAA